MVFIIQKTIQVAEIMIQVTSLFVLEVIVDLLSQQDILSTTLQTGQ